MTFPVVVADFPTTQRGPGSELRDPGSELYTKEGGSWRKQCKDKKNGMTLKTKKKKRAHHLTENNAKEPLTVS